MKPGYTLAPFASTIFAPVGDDVGAHRLDPVAADDDGALLDHRARDRHDARVRDAQVAPVGVQLDVDRLALDVEEVAGRRPPRRRASPRRRPGRRVRQPSLAFSFATMSSARELLLAVVVDDAVDVRLARRSRTCSAGGAFQMTTSASLPTSSEPTRWSMRSCFAGIRASPSRSPGRRSRRPSARTSRPRCSAGARARRCPS